MRPGFEADVDAHDGTVYRFSLTLTDDPIHVQGSEQVSYLNETPDALSDLVFRLYPNALTRQPSLAITSAAVEGQPVEVELSVEDTALRLPLSAPLAPGERVEVGLSFTFNLPSEEEIGWGRLADTRGVAVLSSFLPMLSVYDEDGWWLDFPDETGDPSYSAVALWDVSLIAPADLKVASTGTTVETIPDDGVTAYRFVTGPVRDFSLALSADFEVTSEVQDGVTVNIWSSPGSDQDDRAALRVAFDSLRIYDQRFGLYPFGELDVVEAPISAAGIEYPGLIYITSGIWDSEGDTVYFEWVISHEVAHQWWYSMVGNNQVEAPWIDEGLTEYSVELYFAGVRGPDGADLVRSFYEAEVESYIAEEGRREPVGRPAPSYDDTQYRVFVYSAGALFYNHLADEYGSDAVIQFLQTYYDRFRYDQVNNAELEQLVEETFGIDAGDFFEDWVYEGGDS
jgi:hypothetical protein